MLSFKFRRAIARAFIGPRGVAGNVFLVCCGLFTAFISMPAWSRWIFEHFPLHGPRPQLKLEDENTPDFQARSPRDEDNTASEDGDRTRCLACPPPAEYPIEVLYDDGNATIEYVSVSMWPRNF